MGNEQDEILADMATNVIPLQITITTKPSAAHIIFYSADDKAKAGLVLDTYKAIKDAGVGKIAFATEVKS